MHGVLRHQMHRVRADLHLERLHAHEHLVRVRVRVRVRVGVVVRVRVGLRLRLRVRALVVHPEALAALGHLYTGDMGRYRRDIGEI